MSRRGRRLSRVAVLAHALAKPGAWQDTPWEGDVVVKVHDKIFAFLGEDAGEDAELRTVGVKCGASRDEADEWLARFPEDASVMPYLGRSGWNSLVIGRGIPDDELLDAVDDSYARVVARLPKKHRPGDRT
jgi:predicted DNA-binding protein (MmcQ/YjbR family)